MPELAFESGTRNGPRFASRVGSRFAEGVRRGLGVARWGRLRRFRVELVALVIAVFSKGAPWTARLAALATIAYAISPIDLVPDTIPILGQLDDLAILTMAFVHIPRLFPVEVAHQSGVRAADFVSRGGGAFRTIATTMTAALIIIPLLAAIVVGVVAAWLMV